MENGHQQGDSPANSQDELVADDKHPQNVALANVSQPAVEVMVPARSAEPSENVASRREYAALKELQNARSSSDVSSLEWLIAATVEQCNSINTRIESLREYSFASPNARLLLEVISQINDTLRSHVTEAPSRLSKRSPKDLEAVLKAVPKSLTDMAAHLRFVARATARRTPWSLVQPLEKLGKIIHPDALFIIRPQWSYNYGIRLIWKNLQSHFITGWPLLTEEESRKIFNTVPDKVQHAFSKMPEQVYVVSFPDMERFDVLLHTLMGHEIGHPIVDAFFEQEVKVHGALTAKVRELLKDELEKKKKELEATRLTQDLELTQEIDWEELQTRIVNSTLR